MQPQGITRLCWHPIPMVRLSCTCAGSLSSTQCQQQLHMRQLTACEVECRSAAPCTLHSVAACNSQPIRQRHCACCAQNSPLQPAGTYVGAVYGMCTRGLSVSTGSVQCTYW
jgi:hypothetical protein